MASNVISGKKINQNIKKNKIADFAEVGSPDFIAKSANLGVLGDFYTYIISLYMS